MRINGSDQLDTLILLADDLSDLVFLALSKLFVRVASELDFVNAFKALFKVFLNVARLLGLSQDLNQILIRQEEEAREVDSLGLKVLVQVLLDVFELEVGLFENLIEVFNPVQMQ